MAEASEGDVLMYFTLNEGSPPIAAESLSSLKGADARLMTGFTEGRYFDAENFALSFDLADDEGSAEADAEAAETRSFGRWRSLKPADPKPNPPFKAEPADVTISRLIDASSPVLLKHCLDVRRFHQAVVVKRTRIGRTGMLSAILRMEFSKVWIKAIEWEDGDTVRETCRFKFASVTTTYVRRKLDGTVASLWPCDWTGQVPGGTPSAGG